MNLTDLPAYELINLIRKRDVSAEEVFEDALKRIQAIDGRPGTINGNDPSKSLHEDEQRVHAFITLTPEHARGQARTIDQKLDTGEDPGPLAGVPFTVKDIFCVQGTPSTAGSRILANFVAPYTATPVARMEAAGGIVLGKVNLDEFTYGSSNESSAFQPTPRNPWDLSRVPGGCRRCRTRLTLSRHGHRRFHPPTSSLLRRGRTQAYLRPRLALRSDRLWLFSGLSRSLGSQCDRRGPDA